MEDSVGHSCDSRCVYVFPRTRCNKIVFEHPFETLETPNKLRQTCRKRGNFQSHVCLFFSTTFPHRLRKSQIVPNTKTWFTKQQQHIGSSSNDNIRNSWNISNFPRILVASLHLAACICRHGGNLGWWKRQGNWPSLQQTYTLPFKGIGQQFFPSKGLLQTTCR